MAHSILLVVPKIDTVDPENQRRWEGCAMQLKNIASKNKDIQILGENVVLIPLENGLMSLSEIVQKGILGLNYKYMIFDEEIEWHEESRKG